MWLMKCESGVLRAERRRASIHLPVRARHASKRADEVHSQATSAGTGRTPSVAPTSSVRRRFSSATRISEVVDAALEDVVKSKRLTVREREELRQNHTCNAADRVEPIVGIVDSTPAQAASRSLARHSVGGDQESEPPFVAPVGDEREIVAAFRN